MSVNLSHACIPKNGANQPFPSQTKIQPPENGYTDFYSDTGNVGLPPEVTERISNFANNKAFAEVSRFGYQAYKKTAAFLEEAFDQGRYDDLMRPHVVYDKLPCSLLRKMYARINSLTVAKNRCEQALKHPHITEEQKLHVQKTLDQCSRQLLQIKKPFYYILEQSVAQIDDWNTLTFDEAEFYAELDIVLVFHNFFLQTPPAYEKMKKRLTSLFPSLLAKILAAAPETLSLPDDSKIGQNKNRLLTKCLMVVWQMHKTDLVQTLHQKCPFNPIKDDEQRGEKRFNLPLWEYAKAPNLPDLVSKIAAREHHNDQSIEATCEVIKQFLSPHAQILLDKAKSFHDKHPFVQPKVSDRLLVEFLTHPQNMQDYGFSYTESTDLLGIAIGHGLTENVSLLMKQQNLTSDQLQNGLNKAAKLGHVEIVKGLLSHFSEKITPEWVTAALHEALSLNQEEVCAFLLADARIPDPLHILCQYDGQGQTIQKLLSNPHRKETVDFNDLLNTALKHHAFDVIELLAKEIRDPMPFLEKLIKKGEVTLTRIVLQNARVDVTSKDDRLLRLACAHNHHAMIELLREEYQKLAPAQDFDRLQASLQKPADYRYDSFEEKLTVLKKACKTGHIKVLQDLLKDEELVEMDLDKSLLSAARYGHVNVVELLMKREEYIINEVGNPNVEEQQYQDLILDLFEKILHIACLNRDKALLELLKVEFYQEYDFVYKVKDLSLDPILGTAFKLNFVDIVEILSSSTFIYIEDLSLTDMILSALKDERHDILRVLLSKEDSQRIISKHFGYKSYGEMLEKDERFAFLRSRVQRSASLPIEENDAKRSN